MSALPPMNFHRYKIGIGLPFLHPRVEKKKLQFSATVQSVSNVEV